MRLHEWAVTIACCAYVIGAVDSGGGRLWGLWRAWRRRRRYDRAVSQLEGQQADVAAGAAFRGVTKGQAGALGDAVSIARNRAAEERWHTEKAKDR